MQIFEAHERIGWFIVGRPARLIWILIQIAEKFSASAKNLVGVCVCGGGGAFLAVKALLGCIALHESLSRAEEGLQILHPVLSQVAMD